MREYRGNKTITTAAPGTTAMQILPRNQNRVAALILNVGAVDVYLGRDATVTTTTGLKLAAGESLADQASEDSWYAIVASGTGDLRIVEVA